MNYLSTTIIFINWSRLIFFPVRYIMLMRKDPINCHFKITEKRVCFGKNRKGRQNLTTYFELWNFKRKDDKGWNKQ